MTAPAPARTEHVGRGALLALLIIPVGIVVFVAISSLGVFASIISFGIAFGAYWLYQRGAGGVITRTGAWVVTAIVVVTILVSLLANLAWGYAEAVGKDIGVSAWTILGSQHFVAGFSGNFSYEASHQALNIVLALLFGALGAFRTLRRAFRNTSARPATAYPSQAPGNTVAPTTYRNDVDAPPTGSADDKTAPPPNGV
jgi:hypothetical protein